MKEKAVIYARYSSEKQTEQSIEGQIHYCQEYADTHNLQIINIYVDRAKTGRNDNREEFQKLLSDSDKKLFSTILIYAFDRFARNRYDSTINKARLKKNNIKLISVTQPISENPEGILLESLLEGLAEYYSEELSQKLRRGRRESVEKGQYVGGFVPYGYQIEQKKYGINLQEAKNVKLIYKLYKDFRNYNKVIAFLKTNNILNRNNNNFKEHQVKNILKNIIYTGYLKIGPYSCENAVPVIINSKEFEEINLIMKDNKFCCSKSPKNFILTGKMICGECGANFIGDSGTSKTGKSYYYYTCQNRKSNNGCKIKKYPKDKLEEFIFQKAKDELTNEDTLNLITDKISQLIKEKNYDKEIDEIKKELISIDNKLTNILKAVENGIINDKIKNQNEELCLNKSLLEDKLQAIKNSPLKSLSIEQIKAFITDNYAKSNKKELIIGLVYKIYVFLDNKFVMLLNLNEKSSSNVRKTIEFDLNSFGGPSGTRTPDPLIKSQLLYQLS